MIENIKQKVQRLMLRANSLTISCLFFFLGLNALTGQTTDSVVEHIKRTYPCEKIMPGQMDWYKDSFLVDYAIRTNPGMGKYISDRTFLSEINAPIRTESYIKIMDSVQTQTIQIFKKNLYYNELEKFYIETDPEIISYRFNGDTLGYGDVTYHDSIIPVISSIKVTMNQQEWELPHKAYSDLTFPNFSLKYDKVEPIKAYLSIDSTFTYIYIHGFHCFFGENDNITYSSYLAKLIFTKNEYIGRIVISDATYWVYVDDCKCKVVGF